MYEGMCFTCKHWTGDKDANQNNLDRGGDVAMDRDLGYPEYGDCEQRHLWLDVIIHGDACADVEIPANFGCNYYESDK